MATGTHNEAWRTIKNSSRRNVAKKNQTGRRRESEREENYAIDRQFSSRADHLVFERNCFRYEWTLADVAMNRRRFLRIIVVVFVLFARLFAAQKSSHRVYLNQMLGIERRRGSIFWDNWLRNQQLILRNVLEIRAHSLLLRHLKLKLERL